VIGVFDQNAFDADFEGFWQIGAGADGVFDVIFYCRD
jgi:hypothetical protein